MRGSGGFAPDLPAAARGLLAFVHILTESAAEVAEAGMHRRDGKGRRTTLNGSSVLSSISNQQVLHPPNPAGGLLHEAQRVLAGELLTRGDAKAIAGVQPVVRAGAQVAQ